MFVYASYKDRLANCTGPLGMKEEEAKKMITEVDKARSRYHKRYAKFSSSDPAHKHLIINSGLLGVEQTAQILAEIVQMRFKDDEPDS